MGTPTRMKKYYSTSNVRTAPLEPTRSKPQSPEAKPASGPMKLGIDIPLVLTIACLMAFGLLILYSASVKPSLDYKGTPYYFFLNQLKWAGVGLVTLTIAMYFDYRKINKYVVYILGAAVLALFLVLIIGEEKLGARRAFLNGSVQPSELAKIAIIVYLAFWIKAKESILNKISFGLIPMMLILGLMAGLILLEPDISAAITIVILGVMMFFLGGGSLKQMLLVGVIIALVGVLILNVSTSINNTFDNRWINYINGLKDPIMASEHLQRSMESIVRGGLFGVGIGNGTVKFIGLPFSHTDSIFAVIAEETGLIGSAFTVILYLLLLWRGLVISQNAADLEGKLLAGGLSVWIFMEAIMNIAVMVNLIPFTGNALPFISSGGSSLVTTLTAVGMIFSVGRVAKREGKSSEGSPYSAVADLRWRDRRGREPRTRRPASIER